LEPHDHLVRAVVRRRAHELDVPAPGLDLNLVFVIGVADGEDA
jgi:hypothetical protein